MTFADVFGSLGGVSLVVVENSIPKPLVIGDDYTVANARQLVFNYELPPNVTAASQCYLEGRHRFLCGNSWRVQGALSFPVSGFVRLTFEIPGSVTVDLKDGEYMTSVMIVDDAGNKITPEAAINRPARMIYGQQTGNTCTC